MGFFTALGLINTVLSIIEKFLDSHYVEKHMKAGEARAIAKNLKEQRLKINAIREAGRNAPTVSDNADKLRDDPNNRD